LCKLKTYNLMNRIILIIFFLFVVGHTHGQTLSAAATVNSYSIAQKRLLLISTAQIIDAITQNNLDQDSVMLMARRATGLPFVAV